MDASQKRDFFCHTLRSFMENSPDMMFAKDLDLVYVAASESFARMLGWKSAAEIVGKTDFDVFDQVLAQRYTADDSAILSSGTCNKDYIEPIPGQNGGKSFSSTSKYIIRDLDGAAIGLYGVARDVTSQMELEAAQESSRLSRQMFDVVLEADLTENKMLSVEGAEWAERLGIRNGIRLSDAVAAMAEQLVHPDHKSEFLAYYQLEQLKGNYEKGILEFSHHTYLKSGGEGCRWMECHTRLYRSRVSGTVRVTTFLRDINDEMCSQLLLEKKANTDALTGLNNRASVLEQILSGLAGGVSDEQCALLFIDLDGFKQVNDRWGHRFGDKVLQRLAERLCLVFGTEGSLGRIGGDEFLAFFDHVPSRAWMETQVKLLVQGMHFYQPECNSDICVTCSVGVAMCRAGDATLDRLYESADKAMYRAKEMEMDHICFFEDLDDCGRDIGCG